MSFYKSKLTTSVASRQQRRSLEDERTVVDEPIIEEAGEESSYEVQDEVDVLYDRIEDMQTRFICKYERLLERQQRMEDDFEKKLNTLRAEVMQLRSETGTSIEDLGKDIEYNRSTIVDVDRRIQEDVCGPDHLKVSASPKSRGNPKESQKRKRSSVRRRLIK